MTMASVGQKVISFVYFTIVARSLGVEGTGKYFFALSFTTIFVVFVDFGLTNVLVRETSRFPDRLRTYLGNALFIKIFFGFCTYVAMVGTIHVLKYPIDVRHLVYLSGFTMLFDSLHLTLYGVMRSLGDLTYEAISITASQLLTLVLGSVFLFFKLPLIFLILAFTISSAVNVGFIAFVLKRRYRLRLLPTYDRATIMHMLAIALPFAIAAIFARVYSYSDSILLSKLAGDRALGLYSIPHKITYAFQFVPSALIAAVYPRFSEYFASDRERLAHVFEICLKYLFIIVAPLTVGISIVAQEIILFLYGAAYLPSVLPLQILIVSLLFSYMSFPVGALLNACDRQKTQTTIVGIVMIVNIAMNLLLIPRFGVVGAAVAACVGNILLTMSGLWIARHIVFFPLKKLSGMIFRIALAAMTMGMAVLIASKYIHVLGVISIGVLLYPIMLFLTRAIKKNDIIEIRLFLRKH